MPLRGDVDVGVIGGWRVLNYTAHAVFVGVECVAEFPEGVALEVESWWGGMLVGVGGEDDGSNWEFGNNGKTNQ